MGSDVWILILLFLVVVIAIFTAWQVARGAQQRTNITNPREPDPFPDEGSRINFRPGLPTEEQIVERERLLHGEMIEREARREAERLVRVKKRTQKLLFWKEEREQKLRQDKAILQRKKAKERALLKRKTAKNASSAQDLRHGFRTSSDYEVLSQDVRRYGPGSDRGRVAKLQKLLVSRGWHFTDKEIESLAATEQRRQAEEKVRINILSTELDSLETFLNSFVIACDSKNRLHVRVLERLLKEHGYYRGMDRVQLIETLREAEDTAELRAFETQLFDKETHVYVDDIASYSGIEFEGFLRQLFVKMGYVVELTKITGDQGADLVVEKLHERSVVQAKRFAAKVGNKAVQEIMAAISIYKADKGIVVTNNYFTTAAMELAEANNIGMINREKLEELINKYW